MCSGFLNVFATQIKVDMNGNDEAKGALENINDGQWKCNLSTSAATYLDS
jgi:hypothetical protein